MRVAARLQYGATWLNSNFMTISLDSNDHAIGKDLSVYPLEDYAVPATL